MGKQINFFRYQRLAGRGNKLKLDEGSVQQIRNRLSQGFSQRAVAAEFRIGKSTVSAINTGLIWGWLPREQSGGDPG